MFSKNKEHKESEETGPYSITEDILQERLQKQIYGHICRQLFAGVLACLSAISFGTCLGWAHSVSRYRIVDDHVEKFSDNEVAWFVSINLLGCSLGETSSTFLMRQMGPKRILQVVGPFYILNWWLILTPDVKAQLAARFFLGFLAISYSTAGEKLLVQTVHHGIRRYIAIFYNSSAVLGVLVSRVLSTVITHSWLSITCAVIPTTHYILVQIVPESPVFLYYTSYMAAAKSLTWYRGEDNFYEDMANVKKDWDASRHDADAYRYMLFSKVVYRPLLVVIVVTFFRVTTGYFIFMFFSIRDLSGGKIVFTPMIDSTLLSITFILTKIFWGSIHTVHNEWKIRGFLIGSCFFSAVCLGLFTTYLMFERYRINIIVNRFYCTPMVIVSLFLFFFDMGLNYFPKILIFEYMPFQVYKRTHTIVQSFYWLFAFFYIYFFSASINSIPSYMVFGFLTGCTFFATLFCRLFVVEPKCKSLIQIQLAFGGNPIGTRGVLYNQTKQTL